MTAIDGFLSGLVIAAEPGNLLYCFLGALIGTLIGVLPGVGPVATIAMLLPMTFYLAPIPALIMLAGIFYGAQYGGSTTAILVNLPGENSSVVTCLDGYQMARKGRAGPALAVAALSSLFAGIFATFFIVLLAPPMARFALAFGAAEYFALMVLGLIAAIVLAHGSILKALGMITLGLMLSMVGTDLSSGAIRFTFGIPQLTDRLDFVPLAMGVFAVAEVIRNLENPEPRQTLTTRFRDLWPTRDDFRRCWPVVLRSSALGSVLGLLPGGGAMLSSFAAYSVEKRLARDPSRFGTGAVEGVAAPESANNAGAQTSFVPLLTLGIPGNAVIALMAGAMMIHGVQPGPQVMTSNPKLFWGVIASMILGNAMLVVINLPLVFIWVKLLSVPYRMFYPAILAFCCIGVYTMSYSVFDIAMLMVFGLMGYVLLRWKCEPAPLLLSFVLGPLLEDNFRRALNISDGDFMIFIERPISAVLLALAVLLVGVLVTPSLRRTRQSAFENES
jgi:putative tricarboxylic transport membrane protein